ncbi:MAG: HAMP domain-containing protein, partial [Gammaproteobacteria bacterium]
MPTPASQSLRRLLLGHELAFLVLVAVAGGMGGAWAYFWQQTSTETLRLHAIRDLAQDIRTLLFRQIQEAAIAKLRDEAAAQTVYTRYYRDIQDRFNALRQRSGSRGEDYAIQHLQEAYGHLQADLQDVFADSFLLNRMVRSKFLDPRYEQQMLQGFESAYRSFTGLIEQALAIENARVNQWTRYAPYIVLLPLLIACGMLWVSRSSLARGFVQPIGAIMRGTQQISAGDIDLRLSPDGVTEIADLARGINHMAQELAVKRDLLVAAERQAALGALVPVVAHNIRNPLASIRANAQLLEHAETPAETVETGRAIIEAVDRLGRWVSALVSYLHPLQPRLQRTPAIALWEAILELIKPRLQQKNIRVAREPWQEVSLVDVDCDLMEQALYGLAANALEASAPGDELVIGVARVGHTVRFSLTDRGGGIPFIPNPSDLTPGPSTKRFGTGLGIPIAFKVCKAHGWVLEFE